MNPPCLIRKKHRGFWWSFSSLSNLLNCGGCNPQIVCSLLAVNIMFVWFWVFIRTNVLTCGTPCGKLFPMECHFLLQGLTLGELSNTQAGEQGSFDELFWGYGGITTLGLGSKLPADWSKRIYRPYDLDATSCVSLKSFPSEKIQRCIWIAQTYPSIRPPNDLTDCYWHLWFPICWTLPAILPQNYIFVPTTGLAHPTFSTIPDFRWEKQPPSVGSF